MQKKISIFLIASLNVLLSVNVFATTLQQFNIVNSLSNQDATSGTVGESPTAVLIKFFVTGSSTPCTSTTLAYEGSISVSTGTGFACAAAVTSITFTPVASTAVGATYTAPSAFTPTVGQFSTQITIKQPTETTGPTVSYGPVFDATNGLVATPGTVLISAQ